MNDYKYNFIMAVINNYDSNQNSLLTTHSFAPETMESRIENSFMRHYQGTCTRCVGTKDIWSVVGLGLSDAPTINKKYVSLPLSLAHVRFTRVTRIDDSIAASWRNDICRAADSN